MQMLNLENYTTVYWIGETKGKDANKNTAEKGDEFLNKHASYAFSSLCFCKVSNFHAPCIETTKSLFQVDFQNDNTR